MATYRELMDAARRADAVGDGAAAKRLLELAREAQRSGDPAAQFTGAEINGGRIPPEEKMKTFEIQGSDGKTYEAEAPDMQSAAAAMQQFSGVGQAAQSKGPDDYSVEQYRAAARRAYAAGDMGAAKRLIAKGRELEASQKSFGQVIKENIFGDNDPNSQNFGEMVGSALNKAGEAMTFGLIGDEAGAAADAALGIGSYDNRLQHYRQQEHVLQRDNPKTALGAELGGAVLGAMAPGGAIGTLGRGAGLLPRLAASSATGAAMGGTYGFMEGEGGFDNRMSDAKTGAKVGAAVGFAAPVVGRGVQKLADGHAARQAITKAIKGAPSSEALRAEGRAAYDAIDRANVQIQPQAFDRTRQRILEMLRQNTGFDELPGPGSLTPNSARAMEIMRQAGDRMAKEPTAALPFKSLDQMRRQAGAAAGNFANKTDQKAGMEIISGLDDLVNNLAPGDVVSGDVQALKTLIPKARDVWSRMSKSQMIDDAIEAGQNNYLSGGASGIRNQFKRILSNKKLAAKFTEAEKAAMRKVVNGSMGSQIMNLLGGGLGQLGQIGAGFGLGGPAGAAAGAVTGSLARRGSEAIASRNAEIARAMVANGKLNTLPVASESSRRAIEAMMRRGGAPAN
ncbi:hypothetical protein [Thioclava sp. IC9]|uniref:hypothetical protein n=1 Tax=Thioclava sp. IC9 TaxID=1973007 RepID=UPI000B54494A|nr:hypothetical protein [Thioclava sp. IC9]OWY02304.1 hypothetical protein B6V76_12845 [Thioclava sp. IC9]